MEMIYFPDERNYFDAMIDIGFENLLGTFLTILDWGLLCSLGARVKKYESLGTLYFIKLYCYCFAVIIL